MHQYIGANNHLALMCLCCTHKKKHLKGKNCRVPQFESTNPSPRYRWSLPVTKIHSSDNDPSFWVLESVLVRYFGFSVALYEGLDNWPSNVENTPEYRMEPRKGGGGWTNTTSCLDVEIELRNREVAN
jgi:hypothetical protein